MGLSGYVPGCLNLGSLWCMADCRIQHWFESYNEMQKKNALCKGLQSP